MRSTADWQRSYLCLYVECSSLSSLSQVQGSTCSTTTCCANQFSFSSRNNSCSIKESNAGAPCSFDQFNKDFMPFSSHRYCTVTACVTACNAFVSLRSCSKPSYPRCISALLCIAQHCCTVLHCCVTAQGLLSVFTNFGKLFLLYHVFMHARSLEYRAMYCMLLVAAAY